jgi:hypothetical protein
MAYLYVHIPATGMLELLRLQQLVVVPPEQVEFIAVHHTHIRTYTMHVQ